MWIVLDKEDGLICTGDYKFCLKEYEKQKNIVKDYLTNKDDLPVDEIGYQVIMARVDQSLCIVENPEGLSLEEFYETKIMEGLG